MTEINEKNVFENLSIAKILVAILETSGEVSIPALNFLDAANEDKELQVDYNSDSQSFIFKLRDKTNE
jgi:uncharacterized membrane protein YcaP (DUF421 family)